MRPWKNFGAGFLCFLLTTAAMKKSKQVPPNNFFLEKKAIESQPNNFVVRLVFCGGEFNEQEDAKWRVIRGQLRGLNNTPFGRPTPGRPIGRPGVGHPQSLLVARGSATLRAYLVV
jgi:hypothetical protein